MEAIEARNLTKVFEKKTSSRGRFLDIFNSKYESFKAVDNVSFSIHRGELFSLLGPNGAGKTTIIKMLCGLLQPTDGRILINNHPMEEEMGNIGLMLGYSMIYYRMTGYDNLKYFARLYGVSDYDRRIRELSDFLGLSDWLGTYVEKYSQGMKSKLALARALVHDPDILLLDEPTLGLDPHIAIEVRKKIKDMGKTILLTTHYMEEADDLSDRVGIIDEGRLITVSEPKKLKKMIESPKILVEAQDAQKIKKQLENEGYSSSVVSESRISITLDDSHKLSKLLRMLSEYDIVSINEESPSLLDAFIKLTGKKDRRQRE